MQSTLRASIRKDRKGKRGRAKGSKGPKKSKVSGGSSVAEPKRKGRPRKSKTVCPGSGKDSTAKPKSSLIAPKNSRTKKGPKGHTGDEVTPESEAVTYGCSRCRYAAKGCKTCKNPNFRPRARRNLSKA